MVGQQKEPCVFHLIAAGKPEMPYNCSLVNQTSESLEVDCAEGNYFTIICLSHQLQFIAHHHTHTLSEPLPRPNRVMCGQWIN